MKKIITALCLSALVWGASATEHFRLTPENAISGEGILFQTKYMAPDWQQTAAGKENCAITDSFKDNGRQALSANWKLAEETVRLQSSITRRGENKLKLAVSINPPAEGIDGQGFIISAVLPLPQYAGTKIFADEKDLSFPEKFTPVGRQKGGTCKELAFHLPTGILSVKGDVHYLVQDNRAYSGQSWEIRIFFRSQKKNRRLGYSNCVLNFEFQPYASSPVSLKGAANSGFLDETAEDRKGGWTDQGAENDFRMFPQVSREFRGIPFDILNEKDNPGRTCIVLQGKERPYFAKKAEIVLQNPVKGKYLYLLHCVAWPTPDPEEIGKISVESASAEFVEKEVVTHKISCGIDVGNFWDPKPLKNALVAWKGRNSTTAVGLYLSRIPLYGIPIRKITLESANKSVWMIAGATVSDAELNFNSQEPQKLVMRADKEFMELKEPETFFRVEPGSILDFSKTLDAPAGKYGFLKNRNGHFEFEKRPGVPVRFYGINTTEELHYMSDEDMDRMVDHIAATGYNLVRFHHFDQRLAKPTPEDPFAFDSRRRERLDMLTKKLRDKGIYITVDIFTGRTIHDGEIPGFSGKINYIAYKALLFVHQPALDNFLAYMTKLMTHKNRYTGLSWAEDPAVCMISLVNEDSISHNWNTTPEVKALYEKRFAEYCAEKSLKVSSINRNQLWNQFLVDTYAKAFRQMRAVCEKIGIKAPVTDQNHNTNMQTALSRDLYDYADNHFYNNHPVFIGKRKWAPPIREDMTFMVERYTGALTGMATSRLLGKPFAVSEWDYTNPNPYVVEGAFETGAYAAAQDWSMLARFCYGWSPHQYKLPQPIHTFTVVSDPLRLLSERAGALFFLRGDVRKSERCYPLILPRDYFKRNSQEPSPILNRLALLGKTGLILCDSVQSARLPENTVQAFSLDESALPMPRIARASQALGKLNLGASLFRNDTGELELNAEQGTFLVRTPRSEAFVLKEGAGLSGAFAKVRADKSFCSVLCSAMDSRPLTESNRYLLLHLTQTTNAGMEFRSQDASVLDKWRTGDAQLLIRRGEATITLNRDLSGFRLYALNLAGKRIGELPFKTANGKTEIRMKTDFNGKVVAAYELIRK